MDTTSPPAYRERSRGKSRSRTRPEGKTDYVIGICLLLVVVVLWTGSNFLTQDLFEDGYEKPFLVTYLNTSAFSVYLLPYLIRRTMERFRRDNVRGNTRSQSDYEPLATEADAAEILASTESSPVSSAVDRLNTRETAQLAALFCPLWFIANWSVNASLDYTSVASATILSSMSGFFTLGLGRLFRVETLTLVKLGAVVTSFGGVVLVSLSDSQQSTPPPTSPSVEPPPTTENPITTFASAHIFGDLLALLSALFYALYVILLKVRIKEESRIDMQLFFGFVGLFNILACWPIGIVLHLIGVERLELPYTNKAILALLINMAITLSSDFIYVLAMLKTTPLVVTVGLSLTMPLAVIGDFFLSKPAKAQVIVGAVVVLCSFVMVGLEDSRNDREQDMLSGAPLDSESSEGAVRLEEERSSSA
ncbi:uncharacterized protein C8Q71DRAFT_756716 [Rhodofomes roseus]|uniref:Uncharacterized protein n=1 Tax=Rhodofomes roseus TaxID=34475 RepID=A0A4Y9Y4T0_9APHY|nr:uncharacterized protein C8Q71DRAFT_756716 [Rhodofomes roseus]KAH9837075.1 hypothetical protein C8Q71DRAFT_756716 [Rhodofomes roseus]TFY56421.1 hypothetical protein EVJ58_g7661 [Rhodofomes roseus]